ncbi:hypothetical protein WAF17_22135 [Bernardetia sp. ABR2-2B]|uniref:hypothetical protein n=1 Tax=Bernardetia sp. ABR2-2B TaxID=3127472 RepID=UPI0030D03EB4
MGQTLELYVKDESIESPFLSRSFKDEIIYPSHFEFEGFLDDEELDLIRPSHESEIFFDKKREVSKEEQKQISSKISDIAFNKRGTLEDINKISDSFSFIQKDTPKKEINPQTFKNILLKIENYMKENAEILPQVHFVFENENCNENSEIRYISITDKNGDNAEANIDGDLFHYIDFENIVTDSPLGKIDYEEIRNKINIKTYGEDYGKVNFFIDIKPIIFIDGKKYFTKTISKAEQFREEFQRCYDFLNKAIELDKKILWEVW